MRMIRDGVFAVSDLRDPSLTFGVVDSRSGQISVQASFMTEPSLIELAEALASMSADTVLSHRSAAQIWGMWIPQFGGIEVTTPAGLRGSRYTTSVQRR